MKETEQKCFVIMPISDPDSYDSGHFQHVYDDIVSPACLDAGFNPIRADDIKQTNLIHLDVLKHLIESPMAICDLSSRNPNVLFELGIRQAFDRPVVLIQEKGTPAIFDIAPLRYTEYRKEMKYHQVLEDQKKIKVAIEETKSAFESGDGINSIVKILSWTSASLREGIDERRDPQLEIVRAELNEMRHEFRSALREVVGNRASGLEDIRRVQIEWDELRYMLSKAEDMIVTENIDHSVLKEAFEIIQNVQLRARNIMKRSESDEYRLMGRELFSKASELEEVALKRLSGDPDETTEATKRTRRGR